MPIYEYACSACGHQFDIMQSIKDAPLTSCPQCKKRKLTKLVSASGFQLKGTGWYVTDFREKSNQKSTKDTKEKIESGEPSGKSDKPDKASTTADKADKETKRAAEPSAKAEPKKAPAAD